MFTPTGAFSSFSVNDLEKAKQFYSQTLGMNVEEVPNMGLNLTLPGNGRVFIYHKTDHRPSTYTVLNLEVDDIDQTVTELGQSGVVFEHYDYPNGMKTDEKGIARGIKAKMGPDIAWFKDPAGNFLSVLQEK